MKTFRPGLIAAWVTSLAASFINCSAKEVSLHSNSFSNIVILLEEGDKDALYLLRRDGSNEFDRVMGEYCTGRLDRWCDRALYDLPQCLSRLSTNMLEMTNVLLYVASGDDRATVGTVIMTLSTVLQNKTGRQNALLIDSILARPSLTHEDRVDKAYMLSQCLRNLIVDYETAVLVVQSIINRYKSYESIKEEAILFRECSILLTQYEVLEGKILPIRKTEEELTEELFDDFK